MRDGGSSDSGSVAFRSGDCYGDKFGVLRMERFGEIRSRRILLKIPIQSICRAGFLVNSTFLLEPQIVPP